VYATCDGGKTWVPTLERKAANFADPAFAWGAGDALFFINMQSPSPDYDKEGCLQLVRSQDSGKTWGPTTTIKDYHDRPFLVLDSTGGKFNGHLYCLTHKGLLISADSGKSFGPLRSWARRPEFDPYGNCNPVVLSDGTLIVIYNNSKRVTDQQKKRDFDQDQRYLGLRRTRDGGNSFTDESVVAEYRGDGFPQAAAAPIGSPWKDRINVVWQETLPSGHHGIMYTNSKDRGATFSKPVLLSEQSEGNGDYDSFVPCVAVSKTGVLAVSWYDTRSLHEDEALWNFRIRMSLDGGETWQPSVQVTDVPTLKDKKTRKQRGVGHTAGLVADADDIFHCLWVDNRTGVLQVYTAAVTVGGRKQP